MSTNRGFSLINECFNTLHRGRESVIRAKRMSIIIAALIKRRLKTAATSGVRINYFFIAIFAIIIAENNFISATNTNAWLMPNNGMIIMEGTIAPRNEPNKSIA